MLEEAAWRHDERVLMVDVNPDVRVALPPTVPVEGDDERAVVMVPPCQLVDPLAMTWLGRLGRM